MIVSKQASISGIADEGYTTKHSPTVFMVHEFNFDPLVKWWGEMSCCVFVIIKAIMSSTQKLGRSIF